MCDTSDRTVTSYICPSTPDHSFDFTVCAIWTLLLANLYCVKYGLKCSFTVKLYLSIMYDLVTKAII